ncbi:MULTISPECIES: cyclopropane fatty acyl phospholipid synthase [unclassified Phyllobacterium]|uniref:cyclopropane fatty acyl phospholipid synthase n=1 Tax=unclassified Phyllobacterium TaxID=2638441 RepID=UPI003012FD22
MLEPLQNQRGIALDERPKAAAAIGRILESADIKLNGRNPWDVQILNVRALDRVTGEGSLGLGESYMDGWWECESLDQFFDRIFRADLNKKIKIHDLILGMMSRFRNLQSRRRAVQVANSHYNIGNDFFASMLDSSMTYTCGYWKQANSLEEAQIAKLDLVCKKLGLERGMRVLDIGCGWGSFSKYAAEEYGVSCVGITNSKEQASLATQRTSGLPVEFRLTDYRAFNKKGDEKFDRVCSIGMFEAVGHKNFKTFFQMARRSLTDDGVFLLHTIGRKRWKFAPDPWFDRYIFPNGELPSLDQISRSASDYFVIEDLHNFGADYDRTLMAWYEKFEASWPRFCDQYGERFYRMWKYYLLAMAGCFRARETQLWQIVLSPNGIGGGYCRPEQ